MSEELQSFRASLGRDLDPDLQQECRTKLQRLFKLYSHLKVGPCGTVLYCGICALPPGDPALSQQTAGFIAGVPVHVDILSKLTGQWRSHVKTKGHLSKDPTGGGMDTEAAPKEGQSDDDDMPLSALQPRNPKASASPPPRPATPKPPKSKATKNSQREKPENGEGDEGDADAGAGADDLDENVPEGGYPRPPEYDSWNWQKQKSWDSILTAPNSFYFRHKPPGQEIKKGPWSEDEQALFWRLLKESGNDTSNIKWGMFSRKIPGRVGYVCRSFLHQNIKRNTLDPSIKVDYSRFHDHDKVRERLMASGDGMGTPTLQAGSKKARILTSSGATPTRASSSATVPAGSSASIPQSPSIPTFKTPSKTSTKVPIKTPPSSTPVARKKDGRSAKAESAVHQVPAYTEDSEEVTIFQPAPSPHEVMQAYHGNASGVPLKNPQCMDIFRNSDWSVPARSIPSVVGVRDKVEGILNRFKDRVIQSVFEDFSFSKLTGCSDMFMNALVSQHIKALAPDFWTEQSSEAQPSTPFTSRDMKDMKDVKDGKDGSRKRTLWTLEEDQLLLDLHELYPGKWRLLKEFVFPDREEGRIMNHWRQITGKNDKHREKERERKRLRMLNGSENQPEKGSADVVSNGDVPHDDANGEAENVMADADTAVPLAATAEKPGGESISGSVAVSVQDPPAQGGTSLTTVTNPSSRVTTENEISHKKPIEPSVEKSTQGRNDDVYMDESIDLNDDFGDDSVDLNECDDMHDIDCGNMNDVVRNKSSQPDDY